MGAVHYRTYYGMTIGIGLPLKSCLQGDGAHDRVAMTTGLALVVFSPKVHSSLSIGTILGEVDSSAGT